MHPRLGFLSVLIPVIETTWSNSKIKNGTPEASVLLSALSVSCFYTIEKSLNLSALRFSHL